MINGIRGIGIIAAVVYFICQFTSLGDNQAVEKGALVVIVVSVLISFIIPDKRKEEKA
ncbi:hypothetical protein [Bacillus sp. REN3]|uniref:hypothetical protein n=1 Tax=Bacillus sp. REN3 TaxID=2802440 RepID=UPI001AEE4AA5|nr:hypothetical protein [Bacillus sp. REN3]